MGPHDESTGQGAILRDLVQGRDDAADVGARCGDRTGDVRDDAVDPDDVRPAVPEPIPEADSIETEEAWEEVEAMGGEAPTG